MKTFQKNMLVLAMGAAVSAGVQAQEATSVGEALSAGSVKLHMRPRYESVQQDGAEDADALTLKTRLSYTSGDYSGFKLILEMDDTTAFIEDDYSDGVTIRGTAVIADPEVTEVNQAVLMYTSDWVTAKYGRQRIILDNARFVGNVGWRQDEQTYDALSATFTPVEGLQLFAGYVMQANRIFAEAADHNHESILLNASYDFSFAKVIGYGYLLENKTAQALSNDSLGIRWQGKIGSMFDYNLEYATQSDSGENPVEYTADYMLAEGVVKVPVGESVKLNFKAGYEVLGSDEGQKGFTTSLATLHAFQGWTDKFLGTPDNGVVDTYVSAGGVFGGVKAAVVYHMLESDFDDIDYGDEVGLVVSGKVGPVALTAKFADYSADEYATDTTKTWLMAAMTF